MDFATYNNIPQKMNSNYIFYLLNNYTTIGWIALNLAQTFIVPSRWILQTWWSHDLSQIPAELITYLVQVQYKVV